MWCLKTAVTVVAYAAASVHAHFYPFGKEAAHADLRMDNGAEVDIYDFIKAGRPTDAQAATLVKGLNTTVVSHAGFATTEGTESTATQQKKMFFWYFPAQNKDKDAPIIIWLQGGPGGSSLFGLFAEMGPFNVVKLDEKTYDIKANPDTWNQEYDMLFIDNPVGAGFSYTTKDYCTSTRTCVAENLYNLMQAFYSCWPAKRNNDLYITGESYAGKYVPAMAAYIDTQNHRNSDSQQIPLRGIMYGDGWTDPIHMVPGYPAMMFNQGLIDYRQKAVVQDYCDRTEGFIEAGEMLKAFEVWDEFLNGDIYPYNNYFHNVTGLNDYDNYINTDAPESLGWYAAYMNQAHVRKAVNVGSRQLQDGHDCEMNLLADFHVTYAPELIQLLSSDARYKVVVYSGNLDVIIGTALTARFLEVLPWYGLEDYKNSHRKVWRVTDYTTDVAGWVREVDNFKFIVVKNAGHLVPHDQGQSALDMINRIVKDIPFNDLPEPKR